MALGDVIARLAVHLSLETAQFEKGVGKAKREVTGMERHISSAGKVIAGAFTAMFGAFAIGQLEAMAKESLEYASSLGEVSKQLGVTTTELTEYRYAATQTGVAQEEMDKGLARLSRTIGQAANGGKSAAALFERLGISIRDSNGDVRAAGDILPEIADRYSKLGSAAEKSALSAEVFGTKLGGKLNPLLDEGAAGIRRMRDEAARLGLVMDEAMIKNADDAADKLSTLDQFIKMRFTATVAENADVIGQLASELINLIGSIGSLREEWRKLELTMKQFDILTEPIGTSSLSSRLDRIGELGREKDIYKREESDAYQRGLKAAQGSAERQRLAPAYSGVGLSRQTPFSIAPKAPWPGITKAIGSSSFGGTDWSRFTPGQGAEFIRMADSANEMVGPMQTVLSLVDRINVKVGAEMVRNLHAAAGGAVDLAGAAQSVMDRLFPDDARLRQYIEELALLRLQYGGNAAMADKLAEAESRLRAEWIQSLPAVDSMRAGLKNYMQSADQAAAKAEQSNQRIADSYSNMAESISSSIGNLIGGKTGSLLSSLVNIGLQLGRAGAFGGGVSSFLNSVPAFARGTSFAPGGLSLVGERGPELVNLPRGAQVIPNHRLGGGGDTYHFSGNLMTPEFWAMIRAGDVAAANAGSASAQSTLARGADRRLA